MTGRCATRLRRTAGRVRARCGSRATRAAAVPIDRTASCSWVAGHDVRRARERFHPCEIHPERREHFVDTGGGGGAVGRHRQIAAGAPGCSAPRMTAQTDPTYSPQWKATSPASTTMRSSRAWLPGGRRPPAISEPVQAALRGRSAPSLRGMRAVPGRWRLPSVD